jgi:hypothetical protein
MNATTRRGARVGPATYVRQVSQDVWQARPPRRDGQRGRVNLGLFPNQSRALQAIRLYNAGLLDPMPKFVRRKENCGEADTYTVQIRVPGMCVSLSREFATPDEAYAAAVNFLRRVEGLFAEVILGVGK